MIILRVLFISSLALAIPSCKVGTLDSLDPDNKGGASSHVNYTIARAHADVLEGNKLEKDIYINGSALILRTHKVSLIDKVKYEAAEKTIREGYKSFVFIPDDKNDKELVSALKAKTVRELFLKRMRQNSPKINSIVKIQRFIVPRRGTPEQKKAQKKHGGIIISHIVILMFKDKKTGINANRLIQRYERKRRR